MIAIIDYGAGNLRSVQKALEGLGYLAKITSDPGQVLAADKVVLPGVGAAAGAMENLRQADLVEAIQETVRRGKPFLGICLGAQLLMETSQEAGLHDCLNIFSGTVRRFPEGLKVPHMGWNQVEQIRSNGAQPLAKELFRNIPEGANFYFVHSYYLDPANKEFIAGVTTYGQPFCSVIIQDNIVGTQFHPEKSGHWGLKMLDNFARMNP